MLDTFAKKQDYQLIVDQETFGVLTNVNSISAAHAVAIGINNSSAMNVFLQNTEVFNNLNYRKSIDLNVTLLRRSDQALITSESNVAKSVDKTPGDNMFAVVPIESPTSGFLEKRRLANIRAAGIVALEQKIERYKCRVKTYCGDEIFIPFMAKELENENSLAIIEWADIQEITVEEARSDLQMKVMSTQLIVSRLNAVWEKYVKRINATTEASVISHLVRYELEIELRSGSQ